MLSAKQGNCEYHFLKSLGMTRLMSYVRRSTLRTGRHKQIVLWWSLLEIETTADLRKSACLFQTLFSKNQKITKILP